MCGTFNYWGAAHCLTAKSAIWDMFLHTRRAHPTDGSGDWCLCRYRSDRYRHRYWCRCHTPDQHRYGGTSTTNQYRYRHRSRDQPGTGPGTNRPGPSPSPSPGAVVLVLVPVSVEFGTWQREASICQRALVHMQYGTCMQSGLSHQAWSQSCCSALRMRVQHLCTPREGLPPLEERGIKGAVTRGARQNVGKHRCRFAIL